MPLGKNQASMILIMPYYLEPLERLEKLLTREQVDTWVGKMEKRAVAVSMPKVSMEVSHNLQVCPHKSKNLFKERKKRERCDGMSRKCSRKCSIQSRAKRCFGLSSTIPLSPF